ncbi:response regulator transcription factor [Slackia heliotrinireducens]|uniref:Response regulator containing a CheY-like receiver domain and an HTH DNA-binding domain n=1 Tax=Slackia heliotrinireducens (strain ATCC 29202 / DSM 20476 / NCTC 11029 / RHS 1) TaxID=471855 RepID=C7N743_SLAHD|nr:helix-turn-helix transcriptional regulator [Slackia heliotrinireducens]ACV22728.1 response regulator containing a CheY-like receiver domain and an HTH DNA-binding domain [Slackia heliotrinireducens DSM 20476]
MSSQNASETNWGMRIALWIGFGLFLATWSGGPLGLISGPIGREYPWYSVILAHTAFIAGSALGCLGVKTVLRKNPTRQIGTIGVACYVAAALIGLIAQPVLAQLSIQADYIVRIVLSPVLGALYAQSLLFWTERFLHIRQTGKRSDFIAAFIPCYIFNPLVTAALSPFADVFYIFSIVTLVCALGSAAIQVVLSKRLDEAVPKHGEDSEPYRLSVYSGSVLACLGFTWGIVQAASIVTLGANMSSSTMAMFFISFAILVVLALAMQLYHPHDDMRFGFFIRVSIVLCGAATVSIPLAVALFPSLLHAVCSLAITTAEVAVFAFTIDLCSNEGKPLADVFASNFLLFAGAISIASVFFLATFAWVDGQYAWWIVATVSSWAVLVVIPFLPSRSSEAMVFALKKLPEDEGYETNVALMRDRMAQKYSLSEGETAVLNLLLQGKNRNQIADEMCLSAWTIKSRISSIYKKCGIHSYKELVQLASDDRL